MAYAFWGIDYEGNTERERREAFLSFPMFSREMSMPKARTMAALKEVGKIHVGDIIEIMPEFLPDEKEENDKRFRARIEKPKGGQGSVRWEKDGQLYSPSDLLE